jgi:hypothetical protein
MNLRTTLPAAAAIAFAAAACAQTPQMSAQARHEMHAFKEYPLALQGSGAPGWAALPGHASGYVTRSALEPNSWLAENFAGCDRNQDGKVTRTEYAACRRAQN